MAVLPMTHTIDLRDRVVAELGSHDGHKRTFSALTYALKTTDTELHAALEELMEHHRVRLTAPPEGLWELL